MFDLFSTLSMQRNARVIEFSGRYAIVTPFGTVRHIGGRKHVVYTWNRRFAQSVDNTIGSYWVHNPSKFAKVAYAFA